MAPKGRPSNEWAEAMRKAAAEAAVELRANMAAVEEAAVLPGLSCEYPVANRSGVDRCMNVLLIDLTKAVSSSRDLRCWRLSTMLMYALICPSPCSWPLCLQAFQLAVLSLRLAPEFGLITVLNVASRGSKVSIVQASIR